MTHYYTCRNCSIEPDTCERRTEIKAAIRGRSVTSIRFKCSNRKPLYSRGDRVLVKLILSPGDGEPERCAFKATVLDEVGTRYFVKIDDGPSEDFPEEYVAPDALTGNGYAKIPPHRIAPLDEPAHTVCDTCKAIKEFGFVGCPGDDEYCFPPKSCAKTHSLSKEGDVL